MNQSVINRTLKRRGCSPEEKTSDIDAPVSQFLDIEASESLRPLKKHAITLTHILKQGEGSPSSRRSTMHWLLAPSFNGLSACFSVACYVPSHSPMECNDASNHPRYKGTIAGHKCYSVNHALNQYTTNLGARSFSK